MANRDISVGALLGIAVVAIAMLAIISPMPGFFGTSITNASNSATATAVNQGASKGKAASMVASMPFYFEVNRGQTDSSVRYLSHGGRYSLFLTDDAIVIAMVGGELRRPPAIAAAGRKDRARMVRSAVRIRMIGANPHPAMTGLDPLPGQVNYLIGNQADFHTNIPTFARVKVADVYPGVDVIHYGAHDSLEYDIIAAPGADTSKIRFAIEGPASTTTDKNGNIAIATTAGMIVMRKPDIYQRRADGSRVSVAGSFVMSPNGTIENRVPHREVALQIAAYDHSRPLVIDPAMPILVYSSYIGGSGMSNAPLNFGGQIPFLNNNSAIAESDMGLGLALDSSNNAYVTGVAFSNDFPHPGAFQTTLEGANSPPDQNPNVFIAKFNYTDAASNAASLIYATYLGAAGDTAAADAGKGNGDLAFGIAVDAGNHPFVVGQTYSGTAASGGSFPGTASCGAFGQSNDAGSASTAVGFISKLQPDGSGIAWSCYIDGQNGATEARVALFPAGCGATPETQCKAYIAGSSESSMAQGFPAPATLQPFQSALLATAGGNASFVVVHEDGQSLDYSTLYGGSGNGISGDTAMGLAVDGNGDGYITGATFSTNLTTVNAAVNSFQESSNTLGSNAYLAQFDPTKSGAASLIYATYLGGSGGTGSLIAPNKVTVSTSIGDAGTGVAIDSSTGHIWVTGVTGSTDFSGIPGSSDIQPFQLENQGATGCNMTNNSPGTAAFIVEIDTSQAPYPSQAQFRYSTYFSGCGFQISVPEPSPNQSISKSIGLGDAATDIAVSGGKVFITGTATSGGSATWISTTCNSGFPLDANQSSGFVYLSLTKVPLTSFVAELDPTQQNAPNQLVFSTLLGGTGQLDASTGLKVDSNGNIVVAGFTFSNDFPITSNAFQFTNNAAGQNSTNGFLTVINPAGTICPTPFLSPSPTPTPRPQPPNIAFAPPYRVLLISATHGTTTTEQLQITNSGGGTLTGKVGQTASKVFSVTGGLGEFSLTAGQSESVTVAFKAPAKPGNSSASFAVTSNAKRAKSNKVTLRGTSE